MLGDLSLMPDDVAKSLRETEHITKDHKEGVLNVCICYNSKDEMDEAMKDQPKTVAAFEKKLHFSLFTKGFTFPLFIISNL